MEQAKYVTAAVLQVQAIKLWTHMPFSMVAPPDVEHFGVVQFLARHAILPF